MTDDLAELVAAALRQAPDVSRLDAASAEAWASDLLALSAEVGDEHGDRLTEILVEHADDGAGVVLAAVALLRDATPVPPSDTVPAWAATAGTAACRAAWEVVARGEVSALFSFEDAGGAHHAITVDLVPAGAGRSETVGEVLVLGGDPVSSLAAGSGDVALHPVHPDRLADRVAAALAATDHPTASAVANGRLLAARLRPLTELSVEVPSACRDEVPHLAPRDPDDDRRALGIVVRAFPDPAEPDSGAVTAAAAALRTAAADDDPLAGWIAAVPGAVDLDGDDLGLVVATLAGPVAPADLAPLTPADRDAALTLEWADWLGAVLETVRTGPGTRVDGPALVDAVNRCPEVTSTIPKADRDRIGWAFGRVLPLWDLVGVRDGAALTALGVALLPRALRRAWGASVAD